MGVWSSIYRVRHTGLCDGYSIKLFDKDGNEVQLESPVEIREEVYGGKNIRPIHEWFVKYAKERLKITSDEFISDDSSDDIRLDLDDLMELVDTINKVLKNPKLGKNLLPYPNTEGGFYTYNNDNKTCTNIPDHLDSRLYDEGYTQMLYYVGYYLQKIIDEHCDLDCVYGYVYNAG